MKRCLIVLSLLAACAVPAQAAPTLERGDRGKSVRTLQIKLGLPADGIYGRATARAVRRFQRRAGLEVTGRLDTATRRALGLHTRATDGSGGVEADEAPRTGAAAGTAALEMVEAAYSVIGAEYEAASAGPDTFDCSGLVVWAATRAGIRGVPRSSFAQFEIGEEVTGAIRPGDLVFFNTAGPGPSDVGIASGPDAVISATTHGVREHTLSGPYWGRHFVGARRL